jgi:hypothetical protein
MRFGVVTRLRVAWSGFRILVESKCFYLLQLVRIASENQRAPYEMSAGVVSRG